MEEDSKNETWIDYISFMLLHNQDEDGEGYYGKDYELWYDEGVGDREVDDLSFFQYRFWGWFPQFSPLLCLDIHNEPCPWRGHANCHFQLL